MTMLFFERLSSSKTGFVGRSPPRICRNVRAGSPLGGSTLMTSAPQSARIPPAAGPATHAPISTIVMPSSGPLIRHVSFAAGLRGIVVEPGSYWSGHPQQLPWGGPQHLLQPVGTEIEPRQGVELVLVRVRN